MSQRRRRNEQVHDERAGLATGDRYCSRKLSTPSRDLVIDWECVERPLQQRQASEPLSPNRPISSDEHTEVELVGGQHRTSVAGHEHCELIVPLDGSDRQVKHVAIFTEALSPITSLRRWPQARVASTTPLSPGRGHGSAICTDDQPALQPNRSDRISLLPT